MIKHTSIISARNENPIDANSNAEAFKIANKTQVDVMCHGFMLKYNTADKKALLDIDAPFYGNNFDPIIDSAEFSTFGPSRDSDRGAKFFRWIGGPVLWPQAKEFSVKVKPPALIAAGGVEISMIVSEK